jgi:aryl-alcohol dehydrogenase-like predicted oxidoreductase
VSKHRHTSPAAVSIAWIAAQPGVGGAIASATSVEQLKALTDGARLVLSADELAQLTEAGL